MAIDGNDTTRVGGFKQYVEVQNQNFQKYKEKISKEFVDFKKNTDKAPNDDYENIKQKEADKAQKESAKEINKKFAEEMRDPKNWKEVKAHAPLEPEKVESGILADSISGLSDKAKDYLNKDEQFQAYEKQMVEYQLHLFQQEEVLSQKKADYLAAKEKFEKTPYSDYDSKSAAQDEYNAAKSEYEKVKNDIYGTNADADKLLEKVMSYAQVVNNWKDGETVVLNRQEIGGKSIHKEFETVTLPNGQHAYKADGQYYAMGENGLPDLNRMLPMYNEPVKVEE